MENKYKELQIGELNKDKNSVFAILYTTKNKPYVNYSDMDENDPQKHSDVPVVLMNLRWNGQLGFIGGFVDGNETLLEALHRETKEEVSFDSTHLEFKPLATYQNKEGWLNTHSFIAEVTIEELIQIQKNALESEHYLAEQTGTVLLPLRNTSCNEYENVLNQNFCATSKLELIKLNEMLSKSI